MTERSVRALPEKDIDATNHNKSIITWVTGVVLLCLLTVTTLWLQSDERSHSRVLRIGVLPDQDANVLRQRFAPLLSYLASEVGIDTSLVIPSSYDNAVQLFADGEIDLAYFGGLTFIQANFNHGAKPLIMREIDTRFTSWFLVRPDQERAKLTDYRNKKISFGSRLSTSGHLMPRYFLQHTWQIDPEVFFAEVQYSGAHDKTALLVRDGIVDIGVANSNVIKQMLADGRLQTDDISIHWQTPPFPDYIWAVQQGIPADLEIRIRDAFLGLDSYNAEHARILRNLDAQKFLPSGIDDFTDLRRIAASLGFLDGET